jgi:hypothetical protein
MEITLKAIQSPQVEGQIVDHAQDLDIERDLVARVGHEHVQVHLQTPKIKFYL